MKISQKGNLVLLGLAVWALLAAGCASPVQAPPAASDSPSLQVPVISPSGGRFADASKEISITCPTPGALVFWTDDDSTPTSQSNRFTEPFRIYGTTVKIKAIAVLGNQASAVAVATLTLNDGKSASQLGLIKGTVRLPADVTGVGLDSISIFSDDLPGAVYHPDTKGFFLIDGLNTAQAYNFYFTNQNLGPIVGTKRSLSRGVGQGPTVAIQVHEVLPAAGAGVNLNEVKLKKTGRIIGKALMYGRDGAQAGDHTGIDVYVPGTSFTAKTGSTGSFVLSDIPEGVYAVRADKPGYTFKEATGLLVVSEQDNNDLQTASFNIYYGYGTVTGSATLTDGSADGVLSDGISVLLRNLNDANATFNTVTGADGSYTLTNVEPGSYTAFFSKSGYISQTLEGLSVQGASVAKAGSVSLPAMGGKLSGTVLVRGASDSSGTMILAQSSTGKTFSTGTLADGSYRFDPIAPGTYTLTASHAGYSTRTLTGVTLSMGGALSAQNFPDLTPAIGSLTGVVNLEGALSFEGVAVTARKSDDALVSLSAVTDAQGTYILSDLKPGIYLVRFAKDGFLAGDGVTVTLVADGIVTAGKVVLTSSKAKLAGTAQLQGTTDFAGVAILASGAAGRTYSTVTDATGRYALVGLEPDTYTVQATKDGYTTAKSDPQLLGAGASKDGVALSLTVSSRSVVGKVTLEGLTVFSGTKITATNLADVQKIYSALSNNDGYFVLSGLVPGSYILSFSRENYKGVTTNAVSLATTSTVTIPDLRLDQARGGITGIARSEGRTSHAGTTVTLVGTSNVTTTAADGTYTFQVPSGNYPGGVRFERTDFETTQDTGTVTVLTDSTYGVPTATLKATHNTLKGVVDLLGTVDDSGITVALDGQSGFTTTTAADGTWKLDHVPLGTVTVRFTRANTPDVTSSVVVGPADLVTVPKLDMIPNASSLKGWVKLTGMTDHAGITVTVTTENKPDLTGTTNASGAFEIGNILSTGSHTVTVSKAGWVSQSFTISDFAPLEVRTVGQVTEIALVDTAAPSVTSVVINSGANITDNADVSLALNVTELGTGPDRMQVSWDGVFDVEPWEPYAAAFNKTIPSVGNQDYTVSVRVRDKAGNVSAAATDTIQLNKQFVTLSGVLSGDALHWVKAKGIYKVVGTMVVEEGSTLVVDPGVEVQFTGDFSLAVRGTIQVRGTAAEPVIFTRDAAYTGLWTGIALQGDSTVRNGYDYVSGSIFEHANVSYAKTAVSSTGNLLIRYNRFDGTNQKLTSGNGDLFFDNDVSCGFMLSGTTVNSIFHDISMPLYTGNWEYFSNTILRNCTLQRITSSYYFPVFLGKLQNNELNDLSNARTSGLENWPGEILISSDAQFNNIYDIWSPYAISTGASVGTNMRATNNFWGLDKNAELSQLAKVAGGNASFIWDYYDDPINLGKIQFLPYASEPWDFAGYKGEAFIDADFDVNGWDFTAKGDQITEPNTTSITVSPKVLFHNHPVTLMRVAQSINDLKNASWTAFSSSKPWTIDSGKLVDGYAELYLQVKDDQGNVSGIAMHRVAYDSPTVSKISLTAGTTFTTETNTTVKWSIRDGGKITRAELLLNGARIYDAQASWGVSGSWGVETSTTLRLLLSAMGAGSYTLTARATDETGRQTSVDVPFTISRSLGTVAWGAGTSWSASTGQPLKDSGTVYLWHFDGDGSEAGGDSANAIGSFTADTGGLGSQSSSNFYTYSTIPISFSGNSYTVEWWQKGASNVQITKSGSWEVSLYTPGSPYEGWYYVQGGGSASDYFQAPSQNLADGLWHHIAFVYSGTDALIYVDGVPVAFKDGFSQTLFDNANKLSASAYNGTYDEPRISRVARSGDELKAYVDYVRTNNLIQ